MSIEGNWISSTILGTFTLSIDSSTLTFQNYKYPYVLKDGNLYVNDANQWVIYPFSLMNDVLTIQFPELYTLSFARNQTSTSSTSSTNLPSAEKVNVNVQYVNNNNNIPKTPDENEKEVETNKIEKTNENIVSSSEKSKKEALLDHQLWNFCFTALPKDWKYQFLQNSTTAIFGHGVVAGMILIVPHEFKTVEQVKVQMLQGIKTEDGTVFELEKETLKVDEESKKVSGCFKGFSLFNYVQMKSYSVGLVCPYKENQILGGGVSIFCVVADDKFGNEIRNAIDELVGSIRFKKEDLQKSSGDLYSNFTGQWTHHKTSNLLFSENSLSSTDSFYLSKEGTYSNNYESSYSGNLDNGWGKTGSYLGYNTDSGKGKYVVKGDKKQGVIVFVTNKGEKDVWNYRVHSENNQTYWNEYYFNNKLYYRS